MTVGAPPNGEMVEDAEPPVLCAYAVVESKLHETITAGTGVADWLVLTVAVGDVVDVRDGVAVVDAVTLVVAVLEPVIDPVIEPEDVMPKLCVAVTGGVAVAV